MNFSITFAERIPLKLKRWPSAVYCPPLIQTIGFKEVFSYKDIGNISMLTQFFFFNLKVGLI